MNFSIYKFYIVDVKLTSLEERNNVTFPCDIYVYICAMFIYITSWFFYSVHKEYCVCYITLFIVDITELNKYVHINFGVFCNWQINIRIRGMLCYYMLNTCIYIYFICINKHFIWRYVMLRESHVCCYKLQFCNCQFAHTCFLQKRYFLYPYMLAIYILMSYASWPSQ